MRYTKNAAECSACAQARHAQPVRERAYTAPTDRCRVTLPVLAFIEPQTWDRVYSEGQALACGTLFPALDKPFMGKGGCCGA